MDTLYTVKGNTGSAVEIRVKVTLQPICWSLTRSNDGIYFCGDITAMASGNIAEEESLDYGYLRYSDASA